MLSFACPKCGAIHLFRPSLAGQHSRCARCGITFVVPEPPPGSVGSLTRVSEPTEMVPLLGLGAPEEEVEDEDEILDAIPEPGDDALVTADDIVDDELPAPTTADPEPEVTHLRPEDVLDDGRGVAAIKAPRPDNVVFRGNNGTAILQNGVVTIHHLGGQGFLPTDRRVRPGVYTHSVLSIGSVDIQTGVIRFVLGNEARDPARDCPVVDEQALTFGTGLLAEAMCFRIAVERHKSDLLKELQAGRE